MAANWSREQVVELLATERFTYQRIELPYGLATDGADRSGTAKAIFPESLAGKSVLDLGCNNGFFCFEAAKRGAKRVLGLDVEPDMIRKNRILADVLGLNVDFGVMDLDRQRLNEPFDYVLCLNVLHHLRYPLYVLENLSEIVRERLVLEMASFNWRDSIRMGSLPLLSPVISRLPVVYVSPGHSRKKLKRFVITAPAITNLLMQHRRIFARCDIRTSDHKSRFLVSAEKYGIDHLVVVAAPVKYGATAFSIDLKEGKRPAVAAALGLDFTDATLIGGTNQSRAKLAFMEYDILNPFMRTGNVYSRDVELDLLSVAKKVTFVTLKSAASDLAEHFRANMGRGRFFRRPSKRDRHIHGTLLSEAELATHYRPWFAYIKERGNHSIAVDLSKGGQVITDDEFLGTLAN